MTDWETLYQQAETVWGEKPDARLLDIAPLIPRGRVLDLGMGEGRNAIFFARSGFEVRAVDLSTTAVEKCKGRAAQQGISIRAEAGSMLDVVIEPSSLSLVICTMALQFTKKSESERLIENIQQGLQPGGMVYVTTFSTEDPGCARSKQSSEEVEPNTFYNERVGSYVHYFERDEMLKGFHELKLHYFAQSIELDSGHPGVPEPHYHGIISYIGQREH